VPPLVSHITECPKPSGTGSRHPDRRTLRVRLRGRADYSDVRFPLPQGACSNRLANLTNFPVTISP